MNGISILYELKYSWLNTINKYNLSGLFLCAMLLGMVMPDAAYAGENESQRHVALNEISEIKLPDETASVLLGNPEIADILVQSGSAVLVTGKRIGTTNLLVRNKNQAIILNLAITVDANQSQLVSLYRGATRLDYACLPHCERVSNQINPTPNEIQSEAKNPVQK